MSFQRGVLSRRRSRLELLHSFPAIILHMARLKTCSGCKFVYSYIWRDFGIGLRFKSRSLRSNGGLRS